MAWFKIRPISRHITMASTEIWFTIWICCVVRSHWRFPTHTSASFTPPIARKKMLLTKYFPDMGHHPSLQQSFERTKNQLEINLVIQYMLLPPETVGFPTALMFHASGMLAAPSFMVLSSPAIALLIPNTTDSNICRIFYLPTGTTDERVPTVYF